MWRPIASSSDDKINNYGTQLLVHRTAFRSGDIQATSIPPPPQVAIGLHDHSRVARFEKEIVVSRPSGGCIDSASFVALLPGSRTPSRLAQSSGLDILILPSAETVLRHSKPKSSPKGTLAVLGSNDKAIRLWDVKAMEKVPTRLEEQE